MTGFVGIDQNICTVSFQSLLYRNEGDKLCLWSLMFGGEPLLAQPDKTKTVVPCTPLQLIGTFKKRESEMFQLLLIPERQCPFVCCR